MAMQIKLIDLDHIDWPRINEFLQEQFSKKFSADLKEFPEHYLVIYKNNEPVACMGVTFPTVGSFFCEQYLDRPIETIISEHVGECVNRSEILQLGSIASTSIYAAVEMVQLAPLYIQCMGAKYALCTLTKKLSTLLKKLNVDFKFICDARKEKLKYGSSDWGSYYESEPMVGFVDCTVHKEILFDVTDRIRFNKLDIELKTYKNRSIRHAA